jgi:hypothetical protein
MQQAMQVSAVRVGEFLARKVVWLFLAPVALQWLRELGQLG